MNKLITIPDEILIELKVLAAKSNLPLKNFIEQELNKLVKKQKEKK